MIFTSDEVTSENRWQIASRVTSYSSIVIARAHWRHCDLHLWITTMNIDFSPPGIHGLRCKNTGYLLFALVVIALHLPIRFRIASLALNLYQWSDLDRNNVVKIDWYTLTQKTNKQKINCAKFGVYIVLSYISNAAKSVCNHTADLQHLYVVYCYVRCWRPIPSV